MTFWLWDTVADDGPHMTRVLVTGATGFVGQVLCACLARSGYVIRAALRTDRPVPAWVAETSVVGEIGASTGWQEALDDVELVIHAAGRTHVLHDSAANADLYLETNARGTLRLAQEAAGAGVRRFVYLSSIKVNGEETAGRAYQPGDEPRPLDDYGRSKLRAEAALTSVAADTRMEAVIVRPPLVYGPGVRANFLRLMHWVDRQWPLPFGAVDNRRSLVSVWNLTDLLVNLLVNPAAAGRIWMVSDGEDLSTPELIRRLARAMRRRARLLYVPVSVLQLCASMTGARAEIARLCGSLTVDCAATRADLGWSAPIAMDDALARTASWYRSGTA